MSLITPQSVATRQVADRSLLKFRDAFAEPMRNIQLVLGYDGTEYFGWERQREFRSVQQTVEEAIRSLTGETLNVVASGRTDAGVHAIGQIANFHTNSRHDCATFERALNALLPPDIRVFAARETAESFHATYAATGKLYRYVMHDGAVMDPLLRRYAVHCPRPLDDAAMHRAAQSLAGQQDFSSFETAGSPRQSSVRTITHIAVFRDGPERIWCTEACDVAGSHRANVPAAENVRGAQAAAESRGAATAGEPPSPSGAAASRPQNLSLVYLEVAADGFLYNMVRAIAGTLIQVGRGYWPVQRVREVLESRDRTKAGPTAAPHGLFLVRVDYPP